MNHTKGKWTIKLTGVNKGDDKLIIGHPNPNDFNVTRTIGRLSTYGTTEENKANARLIAAAPDLLTALEQIKILNAGKDNDIDWLCDKAIIKTKLQVDKLIMKRKKNIKLDKPLPEIAQSFADRFIASYGIVDAEQIAKLVYEKVVASRKGLERKYGNRK